MVPMHRPTNTNCTRGLLPSKRTPSSIGPGAVQLLALREPADRVIAVMRDQLKFEFEAVVEISNTSYLRSPIPLELLTLEQERTASEYEPGPFPALMYRESDHVILNFGSGKTIIGGTMSEATAQEAVSISPLILTMFWAGR